MTAPRNEQSEIIVVTASLTNGVVRVTHGMRESLSLMDEILLLEHTDWETTLSVGDLEFRQTSDGEPFPDHQLRISVSPSVGYAALNYTDNSDPEMAIANSYNRRRPPPDIYLVFNGTTGSVFPRTAAIPITDARNALAEWLRTRKRPTCIEWRPYDEY